MTKILYLDHPQFDLGAFNLYSGLCEILGPENIVVFPKKRIYYGQIDDHRGEYIQFLRRCVQMQPLPYGIPPLSPGEDIINGWPYASDKPYYIIQREQPELSEHDIVQNLKKGEYDFIVLASNDRVSTIQLARLRDHLGGLENLPPIIYVDNGEYGELNEHWVHIFHPKIIFKVVLTPSVYNYIKAKHGWEIYPLPQSSCLANKDLRDILSRVYEHKIIDKACFDDSCKHFDITYAMGMTHDKRKTLLSILQHYKMTRPQLKIHPGGCYPIFLDAIARSKMAISMRGSGKNTTRYWDIPLFHTMIICDGTMGCIHPHPFEDQKTAVFYEEDRLDKVPDLIEYYLQNEQERIDIANAGYEHLHRYHTNKARSEYFLEIVEKELRQT